MAAYLPCLAHKSSSGGTLDIFSPALGRGSCKPARAAMFRAVSSALVSSARKSAGHRGFSAAAAAAESVKVPITVFGPAGKYASAVYVAAVKNKALEAVESELTQLADVTSTNQNFNMFLRDPSVPKDVRIKGIEDILGEAKFSPITKNLLAVLADNGRLSQLPKIASTYAEILMAHRGQVQATVTAALELSPQELSEVKEALVSFLEPGQTLELTQKVDRSLIGGLTVDIGERHVDLSIRSRIKQLEKVLADNV